MSDTPSQVQEMSTELHRELLRTEIEVFDLGCAKQETRQFLPVPFLADSIFGHGLVHG